MILFIIPLVIPGLLGLGEVELKSPIAVRAGDNLELDCLYDLEGAPLYSVKFYQGDEEFYRYVPKESPPTRVFPRPKLQVDLGGSNSTRVTLRAADKDLTGAYKCEVSADAPLFHTAIRTAHLVVTVEPQRGPEIQLEKTKYTPGERLRANCSSSPAFPAANLTFYLNGAKVERSDRNRLWWYLKSEERGLESSRLELETIFPGGNLQLSCRSVQFSLYSRTVHVDLTEDAPLIAHVLGPTSSHDSEGGLNMGHITTRGTLFLLWLTVLKVIYTLQR
ncbi:uncharacterized protein [Halyomorpha halys]|uniref:uncharacterized protein n=1 Tax=Halyomorpha halys TaxID=286706 RepID=UPI0006D4C89A